MSVSGDARRSRSPTTRACSATRGSSRALWNTVVLAVLVRAPVARHRRADGVAHRAHRPARPARDPEPHHGVLRHAALPRRLRVGDARRPQRRLSQQALPRASPARTDPLLNIFTMPGLIFVVALYTFPYVYIMIANTLELIASDLEEAAAILGASRLWVARDDHAARWSLPAILSGFILSVLQALALFGSPAILGAARGLSHDHDADLVALPVPAARSRWPPRSRCRCSSPRPSCCSSQKKLLGRRGYAAVGGKGGQRRAHPRSGRGATPRSAAASPSWRARSSCPTASSPRPPSRARGRSRSPGTTSRSPTGRSRSCRRSTQAAIVNTLELGVLTACVGAALAALLAYVTNRKLIAGHQVLGLPRARARRHPGRGPRRRRSSSPTRGRPSCSTARSGSSSSPTSPRRCPSATRSPTRRFAASTPSSRRPGASSGAGRLARAPRDHGAAGAERHHRHVVLRLHRRHPRAVRLDPPLHAEHQGHLGGDLRPQGRGPVRRHRRPRPVHARR